MEGNIIHLRTKTKEDNLLCDLQYEYDLNGNRTAKMGSMTLLDALGNISLQSRDYTIDMMGEIVYYQNYRESRKSVIGMTYVEIVWKNVKKRGRMKVLEYNDSNHNSFYLIELLNSMTKIKENYYWVIADLDLIPIFHSDYSGIGNKEKTRIVINLLKTIEKNKIAILEYKQLMQVLDDTLSIRNAVIICLEKSYEIDLDLFRPTVESENKRMYDSRAKYEIRILDGELFFIITE